MDNLPGVLCTRKRWRFIDGNSLLGIFPSTDSGMHVCGADKGLLKVGEDGVIMLASQNPGLQDRAGEVSATRYGNAVAEAFNGTVYFSDLSSRFGFGDWFLGLIQARPAGRLLKYDPVAGKASVMLDGLGFANGVAVSRDGQFVAVCDTLWFRCMKQWLKGDKAEQSEILVNNLPGCPDNIRLAPDGTFWVALQQGSLLYSSMLSSFR
ncbi:hypothetical protein E2562_020855 [Oryza meyeriana var. granulata]|uniref:Strictosidine synthase conserved region domain-containing protein n=1 Tax=Oryza meyeriana var. granulata TaxID=110450 RepID=A0A6G1D5T4_9ORYZ|nr:hypothetical protein E2562_020855 [Oryza meyeriana var. granulata]